MICFVNGYPVLLVNSENFFQIPVLTSCKCFLVGDRPESYGITVKGQMLKVILHGNTFRCDLSEQYVLLLLIMLVIAP